jgi:hypothetical protein
LQNIFIFYYGGYKMCIETMEAIKMISNIAVTIAVIFSGIALFFSSQTNKLQKESIQANMFNDITKRINELMDKIPVKSKISDFRNWNLNLLNAFEHYSFFANHGYLRSEMVSHYKNYIVDYCDTLQSECPEAIEHLGKTKSPEQYYELKKYYRNITSKNAPI